MTDIVQSGGDSSVKPSIVLVVEDDKFYSNIYKVKLAKEGFDIRVANNGREALAFAREKMPELVLMDLIMPDMDGFEALREFKSDEKLRNIPVVVLSNLSQEEDIKRVMEAGALDYIVKANISLQDMVDRVRKYLSK